MTAVYTIGSKLLYDSRMSTIYDAIITLMRQHGIAYQEYDHEPILNYEDAEKQK